MKKKITMIGVAHMDQHIEGRLETAFESIQPDAVALEYPGEKFDAFSESPEVQDFLSASRERLVQLFERHGLPSESLFEGLYGAEINVCRELCEKKGIPIIYTDSPAHMIGMSRALMAHADPLFDILEAQMSDPHYVRFMTDHEAYSRLQDGLYELWVPHFRRSIINDGLRRQVAECVQDGTISYKRDGIQEGKIRRYMGRNPSSRLLTVGGLAHLADVPDVRTLFARLREDVENRFAAIEFTGRN